MSTEYITNPPAATPVVTVIQANQAPNPLPAGGQKIPAFPNFPGAPQFPTDELVLGFIESYEGEATVPASIGTGGAQLNQLAIDQFNATAQQYQASQEAAWKAAGAPANWTPASLPVASPVPAGPCLVIMDPSNDGSGWVYPATTGPLAGVCPPFVPSAAPSQCVYFGGWEGYITWEGKNALGQLVSAVLPTWSAFAGTNVTPSLPGSPTPSVVMAGQGAPNTEIENENGPGPIPALGSYQVLNWGGITYLIALGASGITI